MGRGQRPRPRWARAERSIRSGCARVPSARAPGSATPTESPGVTATGTTTAAAERALREKLVRGAARGLEPKAGVSLTVAREQLASDFDIETILDSPEQLFAIDGSEILFSQSPERPLGPAWRPRSPPARS